MGLMKFTVIWIWDDNGQVGSRSVIAKNEHSAFEQVAKSPPASHDQVTLIAVVPGRVTVTTPCDDGMSSSCALVDYPIQD
jgi:hypothetical protein